MVAKTDGDKTDNQNVPWLWLICISAQKKIKTTYATFHIYQPVTAHGFIYVKGTFWKQLVQQLTLLAEQACSAAAGELSNALTQS